MALAVAAAKRGTGQTGTNPLVGAVIVKQDQVLATGYHHRFGGDHAEVNALKQLADPQQARGATLYVTLEPCCHYGKTPPCTQRLIAAGIRQVVVGQRDPNPLVAGQGIAELRATGITVTVLNCTREVNRAYNFFYQHHRPLVTLKYAMSLDGKLNGPDPRRTRLTGVTANRDSQRLRATQQAILIGERTLQIDDPLLTVRDNPPLNPPRRLVLVNNPDQLSPALRLFQTPEPVYLLSRRPTKRKWPNQVRVMPRPDWTPDQVMTWLAQQGVQSLLIEGGSQIQADWLAADLVDDLTVYLAALALGGTGLPVAQGAGVMTPLRFTRVATKVLGNSVRLTYRKERGTCSQD